MYYKFYDLPEAVDLPSYLNSLAQSNNPFFEFKSEEKDLVCLNPLIKFEGKFDRLEITLCNPVAEEQFKALVDVVTRVKPEYSADFSGKNIFRSLQECLKLLTPGFALSEYLGFYGSVGFDAYAILEPITLRHRSEEPDFTFYLYGTYIDRKINKVYSAVEFEFDCVQESMAYEVKNPQINNNREDYKKLVEKAFNYFDKGDLFEVVFAATLEATLSGSRYGFYREYVKQNPTKYSFFVNFGNNKALAGASPEVLVKVTDSMIEARPISGTIERSADAIQDHENLLKLLNSEKDRAELDMLIDLARNDVSRVSENTEVTKYRYVEELATLYHTAAVVKGKLSPQYSAFEALLACLHAGTVTGAPKVAAVQAICDNEKSPRNYYAGATGYFLFNGDMDFCINIRSCFINGASLQYTAGATLLTYSDPDAEYDEILKKMGGVLKMIYNSGKRSSHEFPTYPVRKHREVDLHTNF